jgi:O-antigen ligase
MYPTTVLWFEIGVSLLIGLVFLWTNVEYGLFFYGLALGFPDLALPLGRTINLRVDDVLIVLLLARTVLWSPAPLSRNQKSIFLWQALFVAACLVSVTVETARGTPPGVYETAKMAGCAVIFLALPRLVQSRRRLRFLVAGLICGGAALVIQIHQRLGENSSGAYANFQQLKSAATFDTWNPNTVGQAAVLLVFAAALGGLIYSRTPLNRILWPCLALGFALLPALVFVRGTSLSLLAGFLLFLCMQRRWKWVVVFAAAWLIVILIVHSRDPQLLSDAATVNVATGEGFSHRFDRWSMALQGIRSEPWLGQGFGQELVYLTRIGSEGRAHDAYLAVWLELGVGGLLLFVGMIYQFIRTGWSLYETRRFQTQGALILSLTFALCVDSVGLPTLYWEKLPAIALSLAITVAGMCERDEPEMVASAIRARVTEPLEQHD